MDFREASATRETHNSAHHKNITHRDRLTIVQASQHALA